MRTLELAANLAGWRLFVRRKTDKAFLPIQKRIFARDAFTCQFCEFQASDYQEIVNIDGNYTNNKLSNMVTACCFCVQCLFLQTAGLDDQSGGQLVFLPELTQGELNSFCHVLFCAMSSSTDYQPVAQSIYRSLKFRTQLVEQRFGQGMSSPAMFGQAMLEYELRTPNAKLVIPQGIRLLPSNLKFAKQLDKWAQSALQEMEAQAV